MRLLAAIHHLDIVNGRGDQSIRVALDGRSCTSVTLSMQANRTDSDEPGDPATKTQASLFASEACLGSVLTGTPRDQRIHDAVGSLTN